MEGGNCPSRGALLGPLRCCFPASVVSLVQINSYTGLQVWVSPADRKEMFAVGVGSRWAQQQRGALGSVPTDCSLSEGPLQARWALECPVGRPAWCPWGLARGWQRPCLPARATQRPMRGSECLGWWHPLLSQGRALFQMSWCQNETDEQARTSGLGKLRQVVKDQAVHSHLA